MIDALVRALDGQLAVPVVILMCWASLFLGAAIFGGGPRPKPKAKTEPKPAVSTAEAVTVEFEELEFEAAPGFEAVPVEPEVSDAETYGRHAPPTRPVPAPVAPPRDVTARVLSELSPPRRIPVGEYPRLEPTGRIDVRA